MRLIDADADALIARINNSFGAVTRFIIKSILKDAPTIEAEPVRHGRWEYWKPKYIGMEYSYDTMVCSVCEFKMDNAKIIPAHYCPNCGANMDGDSHDK